MDYRLNDQVSITGRGMGVSSSPRCPDRIWGLNTLLSKVYRGAISLGVMWPDHEAYRSATISTEVKNSGAVPSLPPTCSWRSAINNFTFTLLVHV
jgi:hypothetical protein